jgi:uncharacterized membrane protein
MLATVVDHDYRFGLFLHVLAVVVGFGPTFAYTLFFSVAPRFPRATPAIIEGVQKSDRLLVTPGLIVVLLAGIYLQVEGDWDAGEAFINFGYVAIIVLFALQHAFFAPRMRSAKELAERDLEAGDELSEEFNAVAQRIARVGSLTGLILVVTIFFMTYKPFL